MLQDAAAAALGALYRVSIPLRRDLGIFSMVCGKSCASRGEVRKDVGEFVSSLASAETLLLLPSASCSNLGSSPNA